MPSSERVEQAQMTWRKYNACFFGLSSRLKWVTSFQIPFSCRLLVIIDSQSLFSHCAWGVWSPSSRLVHLVLQLIAKLLSVWLSIHSVFCRALCLEALISSSYFGWRMREVGEKLESYDTFYKILTLILYWNVREVLLRSLLFLVGVHVYSMWNCHSVSILQEVQCDKCITNMLCVVDEYCDD